MSQQTLLDDVNSKSEIVWESTTRIIKPTQADIDKIKKYLDDIGMPDTLDYVND